MRKDSVGNVNIVSTASRLSNSAEKRYTTCEQELLTVVYALEKFRVHVYGNNIFVNTDNRAPISLHKCTISSNRVASWLITIQGYDIELQHIRGVENHLADILNRNPARFEVNEIQDLFKPNTISFNKIKLKTDQSVLKNLAYKQKNDPRLRIIREKTENDTVDIKRRIEEDALF